jgi:hypothetical protein
MLWKELKYTACRLLCVVGPLTFVTSLSVIFLRAILSIGSTSLTLLGAFLIICWYVLGICATIVLLQSCSRKMKFVSSNQAIRRSIRRFITRGDLNQWWRDLGGDR